MSGMNSTSVIPGPRSGTRNPDPAMPRTASGHEIPAGHTTEQPGFRVLASGEPRNDRGSGLAGYNFAYLDEQTKRMIRQDWVCVRCRRPVVGSGFRCAAPE